MFNSLEKRLRRMDEEEYNIHLEKLNKKRIEGVLRLSSEKRELLHWMFKFGDYNTQEITT